MPPRYDFSGRVLVVSELPLWRAALHSLLARSDTPGMSVRAVSFDAALRSGVAADLVLADLDTLDPAVSLHRLGTVYADAVIALASETDAEFRAAAIKAGASGVLDKGDDVGEVFRAIDCVARGEMWIDRATAARVVRDLRRHALGAPGTRPGLTRTEWRTVREAGRDAAATGRELAGRLGMRESTLRNHLASIYGKLGVRNRVELYDYACRAESGGWHVAA